MSNEEKYLLVEESIAPDIFKKVLEAKKISPPAKHAIPPRRYALPTSPAALFTSTRTG